LKNRDIAEIFANIADILEIQEENPFRIRAYRKAAETILGLSEDVKEIREKGKLEEIPGVGKDLAEKITEYLKTGKLKFYEKLKKGTPGAALELLSIPGIGPKTAKLLAVNLKVKSMADLEEKLLAGKFKDVPGVKEKTISNIIRGIGFVKKGKGRSPLGAVYPVAEEIIEALKKRCRIKRIEPAGSLRRMKETVRDIDILVTSKESKKIMNTFVKLPRVKDILAHGPTKSSVMTRENIQVDLRVVEDEGFGAAHMYFTGSKEHNIALRKTAMKAGCKLNEYGLFKEKTNKVLARKEEADIYKALGMACIPPEMREDTGEINLSLKNKLPKLLRLDDIKGDLHAHSTYSDGAASIEDMAKAAIKKGYEYLAITDHSRSLRIAGGLSEKELIRQIEEIRALNKKFNNFRILAGTEVDILPDGKLDFKDSILKELDFVVAAVHSGFKQPREKLTGRIIAAMENKYVNTIAHPTGRLMGTRDSYDVDLEKVFKAAGETKTYLEINAYPLRLDMTDAAVRRAKELGILATIGTDSHDTDHLDMMIYGVSVARRGWLSKKDVLNTRTLKELVELI